MHLRAHSPQGCSAVEGAGLVEGVDWIVSEVASRMFLMTDTYDG